MKYAVWRGKYKRQGTLYTLYSIHYTMKILGVKVDNITMLGAIHLVEGWLSKKGQYYITTPNLEFIKDAQKDPDFKKILNNADLAIPDSSRLTWLLKLSTEKIFLKRIGIFLEGLIPSGVKYQKRDGEVIQFEVVTGVDLMERLCQIASEKAFTIGLLGGAPGVADKTRDCLVERYPKLKISIATSGGNINGRNLNGHNNSIEYKVYSIEGKKTKPKTPNTLYTIPYTDILFVAFGHGKQEKWIYQNLPKIPVKVAMGVGGAFDVISGKVPRAPAWMRNLGMEWLFRLLVQPWRIKRQLSLVKLLLVLLLVYEK